LFGGGGGLKHRKQYGERKRRLHYVSDIVCASDLSDTEKWFKLGQFYARNQNEIEKLAGLHDDIYGYNI